MKKYLLEELRFIDGKTTNYFYTSDFPYGTNARIFEVTNTRSTNDVTNYFYEENGECVLKEDLKLVSEDKFLKFLEKRNKNIATTKLLHVFYLDNIKNILDEYGFKTSALCKVSLNNISKGTPFNSWLQEEDFSLSNNILFYVKKFCNEVVIPEINKLGVSVSFNNRLRKFTTSTTLFDLRKITINEGE